MDRFRRLGVSGATALLLAALAAPVGAAPAARVEVDFGTVARPFLDQHCVRCHRNERAESNHLDLVAPTSVSAEGTLDWDWLAERVEFGEMPPSGEAQPTAAERESFVGFVRESLGSPSDERLVLPPAGLHRLTREEYSNALRDVLGVQIDGARLLPPDPVGHGFDHVTSAQSLSEAHFLQYLQAAEVAATRAIPAANLDGGQMRLFISGEDLDGGRRHRGGRFLATKGEVSATLFLPLAGRYRIDAEVYGQQAGPELTRAQIVSEGLPPSEKFEVAAVEGAPEIISTELTFEAGGDVTVGVRFVNDYYRRPSGDQEREDRNFVVRSIRLTGPLDRLDSGASYRLARTEFLDRSGVADALENRDGSLSPLLRDVIQRYASTLWRVRTVESGEIDRLLALSDEADSFARRLRAGLVGMLASPRFLFVELRTHESGPVDERGSRALEAGSLATRLAAFLWRSVPDETLLARAYAGESSVELARSMLEDDRAAAFARSFGDQWLQLRAAAKKRADRKRFPKFKSELRDAMLEETRRVFQRSLRERRNLWEFIDGVETVVDGRLARHYGLKASAFAPDKKSGKSRRPDVGEWRVASLEGTARRGLLGHGSVLFATSEATRTSPVKRGKWVLDVLLGSAPPPPPPGADNLEPQKEGSAKLSFRERFEEHRRDPVCASCHARMDPIGFGLERFDALGQQRDGGGDEKLNVSGTLPDGRSFDGPEELASLLRAEPRFLEALAERLLVYALGRGLERADRGAIQTVLAALDPECPTLEAMIIAVVELDEFQRLSVGDDVLATQDPKVR